MKVINGTKQGWIDIPIGGVLDLSFPDSKTRRGRVQDNGETCGTLDCGSQHGRIEGPCRIRKLTPKECFRLQGWSLGCEHDEYFLRAKFVNSDSQLYKQAGNGVTVNVIYEIARRFNEKDKDNSQ